MKKLRLLVLINLFIVTLFANETVDSKKIFQNIYNYVVLQNVNQALRDMKTLQKDVENEDIQKVKDDFDRFVSSWKSVQAFYILTDLSDEYLDTPRYIDIFHHGNEDITQQLDLILDSKENVEDLIYKNSHKSINALEYLIYKKDIKNSRVNKAITIATNAIQSHLEDIYEGYKDVESKFYEDEQKTNSMIINALIESSYKLKEWRVGDVAGFSKKYKDSPDNKRGEYFLSKNSKNAILSILYTYKNILDSSDFQSYGTYFKKVVKSEQINYAIDSINKAIELVQKIKNDDITNTKQLYKALKKLHLAFYIYLIDELKISAKIIDADGD